MTPFAAVPTTPTEMHFGALDLKGLHMGSLQPELMNDPHALMGVTPGQDQKYIRGNYTEEILGLRDTTIHQTDKLHIYLDRTVNIDRNLVYVVTGTTNDHRVGVHNQTNIAPRNDEFMHTRSEIHHQKEDRQQKTEDADVAERAVEFIKDWFKEHIAAVEYHGMYVEINGMQVEGAPLAVENMTFKSEFDSFSIKADLLDDHFSGMISELKAGKLKAAGVHLKAIGGNFNAGIALNADSPFG
ncbi:hypothetical protein [Terriglobus sp.]|uniref:hypothetical protein n=1 Tax=Terriglobus sp. TaxID=1889013 RepID=UPI003B004073